MIDYPDGTTRIVGGFILTKKIGEHRRWFTYTCWEETYGPVHRSRYDSDGKKIYIDEWVATNWLFLTSAEITKRQEIPLIETITGGY